MAQVRWTLQAVDDLEGIALFIAHDSSQYASLFVMDVLDSVERLKDFPESGRITPEMNNPAIREVILGNYRIIYRFKTDLVEILTIHHGARLFNPAKLK
jgi:toxin ParE1/3/4